MHRHFRSLCPGGSRSNAVRTFLSTLKNRIKKEVGQKHIWWDNPKVFFPSNIFWCTKGENLAYSVRYLDSSMGGVRFFIDVITGIRGQRNFGVISIHWGSESNNINDPGVSVKSAYLSRYKWPTRPDFWLVWSGRTEPNGLHVSAGGGRNRLCVNLFSMASLGNPL